MTGHARETIGLWDAFDPSLQIAPRTDNREPTPQYVSDPYELPDLCDRCLEDFMEPDGHCPMCDE